MKAEDCKITIHMVSSLDGVIAKEDNSVSWFDTKDYYEKGIDAPDVAEFNKTIDCYVMGAKTYEHALELSGNYGWPYGDVPVIVLSHRNLPVERDNIEFYSGDLNKLLEDRLKPHFKNVWVVGGAMLIRDFLRLHLADEIRLSILPIILGGGKLFFNGIEKELPLHLKDVTAYKSGIIDINYEII